MSFLAIMGHPGQFHKLVCGTTQVYDDLMKMDKGALGGVSWELRWTYDGLRGSYMTVGKKI